MFENNKSEIVHLEKVVTCISTTIAWIHYSCWNIYAGLNTSRVFIGFPSKQCISQQDIKVWSIEILTLTKRTLTMQRLVLKNRSPTHLYLSWNFVSKHPWFLLQYVAQTFPLYHVQRHPRFGTPTCPLSLAHHFSQQNAMQPIHHSR